MEWVSSTCSPSTFLCQASPGDRLSWQQPQAAGAQSSLLHQLTCTCSPPPSPPALTLFSKHSQAGRKIKTQGFGAFPQLIAPLHSWPGEDKTNFYLFYLHKTNVFAILPVHKLCAAVEASAEDSPAEKAQILCSVCSATELLHHTSLSFSLHKVGMIIPINFCQALTVKNESRYENIK